MGNVEAVPDFEEARVSVTFLSEQWAQEVTRALNASPEFRSAAAGRQIRLQQVVTDGPRGETKYYFTLDEDTADVSLGELADPDATITQDYATAAAISQGKVGPQQAFMQGQLKITGNMMKLLQLQGVLAAMPSALGGLEVDY
jgi:putative sterol carrier protein